MTARPSPNQVTGLNAAVEVHKSKLLFDALQDRGKSVGSAKRNAFAHFTEERWDAVAPHPPLFDGDEAQFSHGVVGVNGDQYSVQHARMLVCILILTRGRTSEDPTVSAAGMGASVLRPNATNNPSVEI